MRLFNWSRVPRSMRMTTRAQRRRAVEILRDFAQRQKNTRLAMSDKVGPESLAQIDEYRVVFETAADLMASAVENAPLDKQNGVYAVFHESLEELYSLRKERFDVISAKERADMAERQLAGATEEIEVLKRHIRKLAPNDPLVRLLDNKPGEDP